MAATALVCRREVMKRTIALPHTSLMMECMNESPSVTVLKIGSLDWLLVLAIISDREQRLRMINASVKYSFCACRNEFTSFLAWQT